MYIQCIETALAKGYIRTYVYMYMCAVHVHVHVCVHVHVHVHVHYTCTCICRMSSCDICYHVTVVPIFGLDGTVAEFDDNV